MTARPGSSAPVRRTLLDLGELESNLLGWLRRRFGDPDLAITSVTTPSSAGTNNETLLLTIRSEAPELAGLPGLVVRLEALTTLFPDVDIALQHRLCAALEACDEVPTPRVFGLEEDAGIVGRRFYVMERLSGRIPSDNPPFHQSGWFTELSSADRSELWRDAVRTMGRLHRLPAASFDFLRDHGLGGVHAQLGVARRCLDRATQGREHPLLERTWQWLQANAPTDWSESLAWGDARCTNMVFSGTRCTGLLDWDMTSLAGGESDLAWWLIFDRGCLAKGANLGGMLSAEETLRLWEETTGRRARALEYWLMFNLFWLGAIMIRLPGFIAESGGTPSPALVEWGAVNTPLSILHTRFGTGVSLGLGAWDDFRPVLA